MHHMLLVLPWLLIMPGPSKPYRSAGPHMFTCMAGVLWWYERLVNGWFSQMQAETTSHQLWLHMHGTAPVMHAYFLSMQLQGLDSFCSRIHVNLFLVWTSHQIRFFLFPSSEFFSVLVIARRPSVIHLAIASSRFCGGERDSCRSEFKTYNYLFILCVHDHAVSRSIYISRLSD